MKKIFPVVLTLLGCEAIACACSEMSPSSNDWKETTKVEYRFGDSSVPPEFHRSYTIAISDSTKEITIDSYGDILLTKHYPNLLSDYQAFRKSLSSMNISKHKEKSSYGCTGGQTESISLYKGNKIFFDAYVYHCSGESGTLVMPDKATDLIRDQIPESVDSLIFSTK